MVAGPAGPPGPRALLPGVPGLVPALILPLRMEARAAPGSPWRRPTVKMKSCSTSEQWSLSALTKLFQQEQSVQRLPLWSMATSWSRRIFTWRVAGLSTPAPLVSTSWVQACWSAKLAKPGPAGQDCAWSRGARWGPSPKMS